MDIHNITFTNPEAFEAGVGPVAGKVTARPPRGSRLHGKVKVAALQRIGFMTFDADPFNVNIDREAGFFGLTITQGPAFGISDERRIQTFNRDSAHLLTPDKAFDFRANEQVNLLATNFFVDKLEDYARRLEGGADTFLLPENDRVSLATPSGASLVRYLTYIWGELNHKGGMLNSDLVTSEIEDALIAALILAINDTVADARPDRLDQTHSGISRAEEYLLANLRDAVSRDELAQLAGISIRTLSRAFVKRHGMGPMAFLRQRRLEAARMELLQAQLGEITITEIALRYGFSQPSKFTMAYKAAFNEKPSDTLLKR